MEPLAPAQPMLSSDDILAKYKEAIEDIIKASTEPMYEYERQLIINRARKNWQFVKGNHFPVPGLVDTPYGDIIDYTWLDGSVASDENGANVRFMRPINVLGGDMYKFVAVMGASAPRVRSVSNNPKDPQAISDSEMAEASIRDSWIKMNIDRRWWVCAFHQYVTGPAYIRTRFVTDGRKYGRTSQPSVQLQQGPDGTPVPILGPPKQYDNGDAEVRICSVLECDHPFMAEDLGGCYYFKFEEMRPKWDLLDIPQYQAKLAQYREMDLPDDLVNSTSVAAAEARESSANPSGLGNAKRPHLWRFREWWAQPSLYQAIKSDEARAVFQRQFPDGCYIAKAGSISLEVKEARVEDEWVICKTGRGPRILENPICTDALPLQQWINDAFNLIMETLLRSIPQNLIRSNLIDREAWSRKEPVPNEVILVPPGDGNLNNDIAQLQPARFSDQMTPAVTAVRAFMTDIHGIKPELTGGGQVANTYREAKQRKDQALLGLSMQAHEMQFAAAQMAENVTRLRAKFGNGMITVSRKGAAGDETDVVDMARLAEPGPQSTWHAEADDNFPMTLSDRWDKMWALLKEFPPEVQQALGILDPINIDQMLELLQIPDFESHLQDQKNKTLADVDLLLKGQPAPGQPDPNTGQPGQPQFTMNGAPGQVDSYDDHQFVSEFLARWLISKSGQKQKQTNPNGFKNVELFQAAQFQASQPPQPPPPPPPVRAGLNVTAKPEDIGPEAMNAVLQSAGINGRTDVVPPVAPSTLAGAIKDAAAAASKPAGPAGSGTHPPIEDQPEAPLPPIGAMHDLAEAGPQAPVQ